MPPFQAPFSGFRGTEISRRPFPWHGKGVLTLFLSLVLILSLALVLPLVTSCVSPVPVPPSATGPKVPGLADAQSWIPQGLWRLPDDRFVVGAYQHTAQKTEAGEHIGPVRLSLLAENQPPHHIEIRKKDAPLLSHAGGIAIHEGHLYIANALDGRVFRGPWNPDATTIDVELFLTHPTSADNLGICPEGLLWVGQFYREATLYTRSLGTWHDANGNAKRALIVAYDPADRQPRKALAVRRRLQGFAITPEWVILSCSFGQNRPSDLAFYPSPLQEAPHEDLTLPDGTRIPLYHLNVRTENRELPPMSEEIYVDGDHVWVVFESGARSRFPRARTRIHHILAYPMPHEDADMTADPPEPLRTAYP